MDFYDVLNKRYSERRFSAKKVDTKVVSKILEAVRVSPTAMNTNCVRIYTVCNDGVIEKLRDATPCIYGAPVVFAIGSDENVSAKTETGHSHGLMDASIYTTHIMLSCVNEGLDTCWVCRFDEGKVRDILGIPENIAVHCLLIAGYGEEGPCDRHFIRPDFDAVNTII